MASEFIKIVKILDREEGNMSGVYKTGVDNILKSDVVSFRDYERNGKYTNLDGGVCQLTLRSDSNKEKSGFYTIRINESEDSFGSRLGVVTPLNG